MDDIERLLARRVGTPRTAVAKKAIGVAPYESSGSALATTRRTAVKPDGVLALL